MTLRGASIFFMALAGAFVGCSLFFLIVNMFGLSFPGKPNDAQVDLSTTPGLDALDDFSCPKGQTKILKILGIEDNFSRTGEESAIMRPALLDLAYYKDIYEEKSHIIGFRNFDERGLDSMLITFIEFPIKIDSGLLVSNVKYLSGSQNDFFGFNDLTERADSKPDYDNFRVVARRVPSSGVPHQKGELITMNLADIIGSQDGQYPSLLSYLKAQTSNRIMDISVGDDTVVDFIGVALCQRPLVRKGTTLAVDSRDIIGESAILLGCKTDPNQKICDPHAGDSLCSIEVPLGCYREGNAPPMNTYKDIYQSNFVGGSISVTKPIAGDQFKSLSEASDYCAKSFGADWRVLSFHEGGGATILTHGDLAPKTRMWVDVKDYPAANCWTNSPEQEAARE